MIFSSVKALNKFESLQKRALRFLCDIYDSSYETILKLAGKSTMDVNRLGSLCIEIFELRKTTRAVRKQYNLNLEVPIINQVTFGVKSIGYLGYLGLKI